MSIPVNYLAVVAAMIASMVLGFLWYGPFFGKTWMKLSGINMEKMNAAKKKGMGGTYALAMLASLVMAWVLAHSLVFASAYLNASGPAAGVMAGFWNWLGFVVPVTLGGVLWESKPWKLWFINAGYYFVSLIVMGVIIASWM